MADTSTQDQIEQRLAELPEDVRNAVLSAELGTHVRAIGQRHNLHIDQIGKLEDEVMLVMLGFFEPEAFSTQLEQQLLIPRADASVIAGEVNTEIFLPIRDSLKKFMEEKRRATTQPPAPAPAMTPAVQAVTPPTPIKININPPTTQPLTPPVFTPPTPTAPKMPVIPTIETALTQPTVTVPMPKPQSPTNSQPSYKADPYREPIE